MALSYRDDHDAAISRIAALEQELADAREAAQEKSERDSRRIAMLERELADVRRHAPTTPRRARPPSTPPAPRPVAPIDERAPRGPTISRALLVILGLFAAGILTVAIMLVRDDRPEAAPTTCTVETWPRNARVYGLVDTREVELGSTPLELTFAEWSAYRTIQFRTPGYDTFTAGAPKSAALCPTDAYDLYSR